MGEGKLRRVAAIVALLLLGLLAGCGEGLGFTPTPGLRTRVFPVDTVFKEFYQTLGGEQLLGPAISLLEIRDNQQCQYTERVLMCFNPLVTDITRFSLYPLGRELKVEETPFSAVSAALEGARIIDGYTIYDKFLPLYDRLFGARYVGRPLTELRINQDLKRVEQFFENAGFYQSLEDPNGPVYLIPYGAYLCGECSSRLNEYWSIVKSNTAEQPFAPFYARLGGPSAFGTLLLKPQLTDDGYLQQVYTNVIFYASANDLSQVHLRPLPLALGYETQPPAEKISHDQLVYYEINGGPGHNVPRQFDEFITLHGGRELSGNPISEVIRLPEGIYRQCFENYCLIFDPAASDMMKVRMAPLGKEYIERYPPPEDLQIRNMFTPERIALVVSADRPTLNDNEEQYIRILVQQVETGQPLERVDANLILHAQGLTDQRFDFAPTDAGGMSVLVIPPQKGIENGSRLTYQVCLNLPSEQPICQKDSYLIWNLQNQK